MKQLRTWIAQIALYALFALCIGVFSGWPRYQHLDPGLALIKLSLLHQGQRLHDCVTQTPEELAKLPPNMRAPTRCPRERAPISVEIEIDGQRVYTATAQPSGLSHDGVAAMYQRMPVTAGAHDLVVRLHDSARSEGFDHVRTDRVTLAPGEILVIDYSAEHGGITLQ